MLADKISVPPPRLPAWLLLIAIGVAWAVFSEVFWRFSVRHYTSASS